MKLTHDIDRLDLAAAGLGAANPSPMERLVDAVQKLSMARSVAEVQAIVRVVARELTGADGATFVLRDGDRCYYADEDAIAPLWKGLRFPMSACISGWAMIHRQPVALEDIYSDDRIPADAYRPTFVKSLAMVPIRREAPIGAIGNYWASRHRPTAEELKLLQALADSTSVAMENVQLYAELEERVRQRTAELEAANGELEAFSYTVSHDLRAPLRAIDGFTKMVLEDEADTLGPQAKGHLDRVLRGAGRMDALITDLLELSKMRRHALELAPVDLSAIAARVLDDLRTRDPERNVVAEVGPDLGTTGDARLLLIALENLLGNAWKFTRGRSPAELRLGRTDTAEGPAFFVRDNGAGFDAERASKLFAPFQRFHTAKEFEGTGVGLATVHRIVLRHGGRIWAESRRGEGATFYFTLRATR